MDILEIPLESVEWGSLETVRFLAIGEDVQMLKTHLATDAGKEIIKKIGLIYQINIAPKQIKVDEVSYIVDLKKGKVTKCHEDANSNESKWNMDCSTVLKAIQD
ncbi:hypothetical protein DITRI_Ditri01bG0171700 [Diplodiscus trichospermus]